MVALIKRENRSVEPVDVFSRLDRLFDEWTRVFPFHRPFYFGREWLTDEIRVDEYSENGTLVIQADLPGIDPDKDVELTVSDQMLHIEAKRREEEKTEDKGYVRQELHYGSFRRWLPLPEGVTEGDISAGYKDGILEIRIPTPEKEQPKKIAVTKS